MKQDHKINSITCNQSETYTIRMNGGWDYVLVTFDESTGLVAIHSSFVTCAYSWPQPGRGPETIKEFFLRTGVDYLCDKFSYDHERTFIERFSAEKTLKEFKLAIIKERKEGSIDKNIAREWFDGLKDMDTDHEDQTYFMNQLVEIEDYDSGEKLSNYFSEYWEMMKYIPSGRYNSLYNTVIPIIKEMLKEQGVK